MIEQENSFLPVLRFYLIQATQNEVFLTLAQLRHTFPQFTTQELEENFNQYQEALDKFGLPAPQDNKEELTYTQLRWIELATDPYDRRSLSSLFESKEAKKLNVTQAKHRVWMTQPAFKKAYTERIRREATNSAPEMLRRTTSKAMSGDIRAIELFFKLGGRKIPSQLEIEAPQTANDPFSSREKIIRAMQQVLSPEQIQQVAKALTDGNKEEKEE